MTSGTPELAVIDTSVYVENFRSARFETNLLTLPWLVRLCAVVIAELERGAHSRREKRFVAHLIRNRSLVSPTHSDWLRSGEIVRALADRHGFQGNKQREIHFDVLIALTARRLGAHLITCNAADFRAIRDILPFKLICW